MPFKFSHKQNSAILLLAQGYSVPDTAAACKTSEASIYRWKHIPEFKASLDFELQKRQAAASEQIQTVATESFTILVEAQRELRAIGLGHKPFEYGRVLAMLGLMKHGARWLDLARFNVKLENPSQLLFQQPPIIGAHEVPEFCPELKDDEDDEDGSEPATPAEQRPLPPSYGAVPAADVEGIRDFIRTERARIDREIDEKIAAEQQAKADDHVARLRAAAGLSSSANAANGASQPAAPAAMCGTGSPAVGCPCDRAGDTGGSRVPASEVKKPTLKGASNGNSSAPAKSNPSASSHGHANSKHPDFAQLAAEANGIDASKNPSNAAPLDRSNTAARSTQPQTDCDLPPAVDPWPDPPERPSSRGWKYHRGEDLDAVTAWQAARDREKAVGASYSASAAAAKNPPNANPPAPAPNSDPAKA